MSQLEKSNHPDFKGRTKTVAYETIREMLVDRGMNTYLVAKELECHYVSIYNYAIRVGLITKQDKNSKISRPKKVEPKPSTPKAKKNLSFADYRPCPICGKNFCPGSGEYIYKKRGTSKYVCSYTCHLIINGEKPRKSR